MQTVFWRKFRAVFLIYWQETLAYKAATIIWVLADTQTALIMPAIWLAAYGGTGRIFGMDSGTLVTYYLTTLLLSQFIVCHLMWDIGFEIREGMFTGQLLRPFSIFWLNAARNTSWRVIKLFLFIPFVILFLIAYGSKLGHTPIHFTPYFFIAVLLAHVLSFVMAYSLALTALWTTEFMSIFRMYYFPEVMLSGRLIPVESLPAWARAIADVLPFKYTVSFPAEILLGRTPLNAIHAGIAIQLLWLAAFAILGRVLLKRGTKQYTGFGN